jgi:hypothetical protein
VKASEFAWLAGMNLYQLEDVLKQIVYAVCVKLSSPVSEEIRHAVEY